MNWLSTLLPLAGKAGPQEYFRDSVFVATNPTPGTGIASKADATSRSATTGLMNIFNGAKTDGTEPYTIMPVMLRLTAKAANTSAADFRLSLYLDNINRYSSGGSAITEVSPRISAVSGFTAPTSKATIHFGALTLNAAGSEVLIDSPNVAEDVMVIDDVSTIWWGVGPQGVGTGSMESADVVVPPMWIEPGGNLSIHEFAGSMTADPEFEFTFVYIERDNAQS